MFYTILYKILMILRQNLSKINQKKPLLTSRYMCPKVIKHKKGSSLNTLETDIRVAVQVILKWCRQQVATCA